MGDAIAESIVVSIVVIAWCIPGPPHRWARRLLAERKAAKESCAKYGL